MISMLGARDAARWLADRGDATPATPRWYAEIVLGVGAGRPPTDHDERVETRLQLAIYAEEWGVYFCHAGRSSWVRVTDVAFVHGRDDFQLLSQVRALDDIGALVRSLEQAHQLRFQRAHAAIATNVPPLEPAIRRWVAGL